MLSSYSSPLASISDAQSMEIGQDHTRINHEELIYLPYIKIQKKIVINVRKQKKIVINISSVYYNLFAIYERSITCFFFGIKIGYVNSSHEATISKNGLEGSEIH